MEERDIISEELNETAPALAAVSRQMPFTLPEGYFDTLGLEILGKTTATSLNMGSVPEGYFESLPALMLAKVKSQQLETGEDELPSLLKNINRSMPYSVPAGYFERLESAIPATKRTPVVPIRRSNTLRWLVAASLIFLAGLFAWQYLWYAPASSPGKIAVSQTDTTDTTIQAALAGIEDASISSELSSNGVVKELQSAVYFLHTDNIETALHQLTDEEINQQLAITAPVVKNKS